MERFSQRESILLGYSPQNSFINSSSSPSTSQKSSDVDFHDVFGGPPKRSSSIHDQMRYSFNDVRATNRIYKGDDDEEEEEGWSGKPVFGEESLNRSRTHSDDFFDDIFKGSSSVSSSPRRVHRGDPYSSSPGSRVLSPARPLPPKSDSALLPVQFSLPAKLNKAVDTPPSISSITRTTSLSRFSSQALQGPESLRSDIRSSHRMSYLSQDFSVSGEGSSNNGNDDDTTQSNFKEDSKSSVSPSSGNPFQFHFSIYKWASSKPMVMPLRGRSGSRVHTTKNEEKSSTCESADDENMARESPISTLPNVSDQLLADSSSSTLESNKQENDSLTAEEVHVEPCQIIKDTIRPVFGSSETFSSLHSTVENDVTCDTASSDWPKKEQNNISCQTSADLHHKPDLKPIHSLIFDDDFGRGTAEKAKLAVKNSSVDVGSGKNTKNQNVKRSSLTNTQVDKAPAQSSPRRENLGRNKFKGKVKDFVKMFSHEVSSKAENDVDFGSQRFKKKEKSPVEPVNEEATIKTPPILQEELINSNVKKKIFTEASIKTTEDLKQCEKEACEAKTAEFIFNNVPEQYVSASSSGSVSNSSKANIGDTDGSFHENFQIEELTQEEKTPPEVSADLEEIQAIDAKIRQWSKGKEGNIRSLLTTVQHILWPGSGWKTVPLVDIIEGNAVKRSYQRALLCLHPDKLQQKGATSQQKYIAEKVFDILQEAWDHFNSLGPL